jgi:PAS domain S-box-containing protein
MGEKLRKTGIHIIGDVPWGTHFCQFYKTKKDLLDILVPYFKTGLKNNEFCMWVTSEPVQKEEALKTMKKAVPHFLKYLEKGQIEILPYTEWYLKGGKFSSLRVLQRWVERLNQALDKGYEGLRLTGNTFWLEKKDWRKFTDYEEEVNNVIGKYNMIAICTYSLDKCGANEVIDVVRNHQFALIKRGQKWERIESSENKLAKEALKQAYIELENRVRGRTSELARVNETLQAEINERKRVEDELAARMKQRAALAQLSQHALAGEDLNSLMDESVTRIAQTLGVEYCKVLELLPDGHALLLRAGVGWKEGLVGHGTVSASTESQAGYTLLFDKPVIVEDLRKEKRFSGPHLLHEHGVVSGMSVIIRGRGQPFGVLGVHTTHQRKFIQDDVNFLQAVANLLSSAIERKQVEGALRSTSLYARTLIEASLDPFVTISADGKVMDVNQATELATGFSREKLIGTDFSDYFTEPEKAREGYKEVFSKGSVKDYPLAIRHTSGRVTQVLYNATTYKSETGKIQGVFAAARDISELKQAQEALRAASLYTRSLIEASLDPLVTISADGKIMDVNRATELVTGVPREKLVRSDFSDYFTEPQKAREGYKQVFSEGSVRDYPLAIRHTSGKLTDVLYNATIYRSELGEVEGVFAAARDITELRRAEGRLKTYMEKLEWSNRELQDFAFVASHDLQEPLRKIQAFGDQLKSKHTETLGEEGRDYLERMQNAASRMQTLIQALLNYSRVTTKAEPFIPVDLKNVVQEVLIDLEMSIRGTGGDVEVGDLTSLEADPNQMRQLFQNLIGNALKFHREKPAVKVYGLPLDQAELKERSSGGGRYQIFVEDNGIGFDEKYLDRIFVPFQRLHGRGIYEGTGMGLAICRKIVERHGGTITAKSTPGKGSTFIVTLPMKQPKEGDT